MQNLLGNLIVITTFISGVFIIVYVLIENYKEDKLKQKEYDTFQVGAVFISKHDPFDHTKMIIREIKDGYALYSKSEDYGCNEWSKYTISMKIKDLMTLYKLEEK